MYSFLCRTKKITARGSSTKRKYRTIKHRLKKDKMYMKGKHIREMTRRKRSKTNTFNSKCPSAEQTETQASTENASKNQTYITEPSPCTLHASAESQSFAYDVITDYPTACIDLSLPLQNSFECEAIQTKIALDISRHQTLNTEHERNHSEKKLDILLNANGLVRRRVPADGNCFFKAAMMHVPEIQNDHDLRLILCNHIIDHGNEYVIFFSTNDTNESFEEDIIWIDFRTEVEELKCNGIWTNRAADLLPLALANWTRRRIKILSSLTHRPVIEISPTLNHCKESNTIYLAYIASDDNSIPAHYDGCVKMETHNQAVPGNTFKNCSKTNSEQPIVDNEDQEIPDQNNLDADKSHTESFKTPTKQKRKVGRPPGTPPSKSHKFFTPPKKKLFRKRKVTPDEWKKTIRKKLRMSGKEYTSQRGKSVPGRVVKPVDCIKCKYKCTESVTEEERKHIHGLFWSLDWYERKKDFIISRVEEKRTRKYIDESGAALKAKRKRDVHRSYSFDINGSKTTVCKMFFKKTLDIGDAYIDNAMKHQSGGVYVGTDKRGKHAPHNKTSNDVLNKVKHHIESFPAVDGHYTRKSSNRKYLGAELNISKMYQLYLEYYKNSESQLVSPAIYRKVFNEEYNFSFHVPKKDQCHICVNFHKATANGSITEEEKMEYNKHQEKKMRAREEKKKDKDHATTSNDTMVATFDLQAVLQTPCSLVSQIYYMRKLNCYNLSVYNLGNKSATCYLWSEIDAKRGACEIGSCLYLHLLSLPSNIKHVIFYSDACSGQNRNQFTATSLMHAVINLPNLEVIDHKFLESGHTQMECDSMHSAIEFAKKKTEICIPSQWATVIRMARRKNPYSVVPLQYEDIYDFKEVQKISLKYNKMDTTGAKVNWLQIKWLRFTKNEPEHILFKNDFDENFRKMKVVQLDKKGNPTTSLRIELPRKYKCKQSISLAKKKDLINLCKSGVIPLEYHEFYKGLPANGKVSDTLPDPDIEEEEQDSEKE